MISKHLYSLLSKVSYVCNQNHFLADRNTACSEKFTSCTTQEIGTISRVLGNDHEPNKTASTDNIIEEGGKTGKCP